MFDELTARWQWRPIPGCPGRFVFAAGPTPLSPAEMIAQATSTTEHAAASPQEHAVASAKDPVIVTAFTDGGLISYRQADGTYLHTLNSCDGFVRKLQQLGIL